MTITITKSSGQAVVNCDALGCSARFVTTSSNPRKARGFALDDGWRIAQGVRPSELDFCPDHADPASRDDANATAANDLD